MIEDGDLVDEQEAEGDGMGDEALDFSVFEHAVGAAGGVVKPEPKKESVESRVAGMPKVTVYLDNFSHASGNRRAFVQCRCHNNCRLYVFLKHFSSTEEAVCFLLCWVWSGSRWPDPDAAAAHIGHKPPLHEVQDIMREQYPEG